MIKKNKKLTIINIILVLACLAVLGGLVRALMRQNSKTSTKTAIPVTTVSQDKVQKAAKKVKWIKQNEPVQLPILMYHAIHDMTPDEAANANLIVAPAVFESHIKRLSEEGYYFLSPEEACRALSQNTLPAKKVIWLTFNDSLIDFYTVAYPILKKYQAKATNNVITTFTDEGRAGNLTVKQMKEMKVNGMSFQSHTVNHPDLSTLDQKTQAKELSESKTYLDEQLNQSTVAIAYPAGRYSDTTLSLAKHQYKLGVTTNEGLASAENGLLSLNRVRILPNTSADILMGTIAPALP
ncbi:polysaccharide deacetylase family protein [Streptococcus ratti]|uniref:Polysaccharide deacetylase family protein n=1 Tax=Streptococcus ratti TaxID=1341 RepID=A0A7X9QG76_STRRT|nr:polysaccharide deacetylase family protein [Streptococcus ratti]NMD48192.1 polysaccharide deacetylase family protein [Streptococcus ratti]